MTGRSPGARLHAFHLPVLRARALPPEDADLCWDEGPDAVAAVVVVMVALLGLSLGGATLVQEWTAATPRVLILIGALLLVVVCGAAMVAGVAEAAYREQVQVTGDEVLYRRRTLGHTLAWREPLHAYAGLTVLDRPRRFYVRNQERPPTGRRGPVTQFVILARHATDRGRDLELFRAQPSLETLHSMYVLNSAAGSSKTRSITAGACEERARSYRLALTRLARRLALPVLIVSADGPPVAVDAERLDLWLKPDAA